MYTISSQFLITNRFKNCYNNIFYNVIFTSYLLFIILIIAEEKLKRDSSNRYCKLIIDYFQSRSKEQKRGDTTWSDMLSLLKSKISTSAYNYG